MKRVRISKDEEAEVVTVCDHLSRLGFSKGLPYAFTEHGALMAAKVPHRRNERRTLPLPENTPNNRSQIVTGSQKHMDLLFLPRAFTEHGVFTAANVLQSLGRSRLMLFQYAQRLKDTKTTNNRQDA